MSDPVFRVNLVGDHAIVSFETESELDRHKQRMQGISTEGQHASCAPRLCRYKCSTNNGQRPLRQARADGRKKQRTGRVVIGEPHVDGVRLAEHVMWRPHHLLVHACQPETAVSEDCPGVWRCCFQAVQLAEASGVQWLGYSTASTLVAGPITSRVSVTDIISVRD